MRARCGGFTMVEMLVASTVTTLVVGAILAVVTPLQQAVRADGEAADLQQRMRAAADALSTDIRAASAVRPYRVGAVRDDSAAGIFYRSDTVTIVDAAAATKTYYFKPASLQLMVYDGDVSDFAMVEHVTALAFEYFGGTPLARLDPGVFTDGPWQEDAAHRRVDEDVARIRLVRAALQLESTAPSLRRLVPGRHIVFDVALRAAAQ